MPQLLEKFRQGFPWEGQGTNIVSSENLSHYHGFGLSSNVRLFVFKHKPGGFYINFITQNLSGNVIAIVPPGQLHFLSPVACSDFICIEIPQNELSAEDFGFITRVFYATQKHLHLDKMAGFGYEQFKILFGKNADHQLSLQLLKSRIEKAYPNQFGEIENNDENFVELATQFEKLLKSIEYFTVDHTIINPYTEALDCYEKALYRACKSVFNVSPQHLLKYHLLLRTITLLFNSKYSVELIAHKLGYSSFSSFARFVKSHTDITPSQIRKQFESVFGR